MFTAQERKDLLEKLVLAIVPTNADSTPEKLVTYADALIDQMERYHESYNKAEAKVKTV